jgi:hypothetical protein
VAVDTNIASFLNKPTLLASVLEVAVTHTLLKRLLILEAPVRKAGRGWVPSSDSRDWTQVGLWDQLSLYLWESGGGFGGSQASPRAAWGYRSAEGMVPGHILPADGSGVAILESSLKTETHNEFNWNSLFSISTTRWQATALRASKVVPWRQWCWEKASNCHRLLFPWRCYKLTLVRTEGSRCNPHPLMEHVENLILLFVLIINYLNSS